MSPSDEQRVTTTYSLNLTTKKVVAQFSQPLANLMMRPEECTKMCQILLSCARELDAGSVAGFTWPGMEEPIRKEPIAESPRKPS